LEKTFEKRIIDKVTTPLYQILNDIELAEVTDNTEILSYIFTGMKQKIEKSISEYVKEKENDK